MAKMLFMVPILLIAACASSKGPIIDTKGVDMARYQQDLAECEDYSKQVQASRGVAKGTVAGAAVGAAIGAISGNAAVGAGVGGVSGGAQSGRMAEREKADVTKNCLRGRGYRVLN